MCSYMLHVLHMNAVQHHATPVMQCRCTLQYSVSFTTTQSLSAYRRLVNGLHFIAAVMFTFLLNVTIRLYTCSTSQGKSLAAQ